MHSDFNASSFSLIAGTVHTAQVYWSGLAAEENGFFDWCAHLGSNQGPKDYESDGHISWKWGKNAISTLQKQYMNNF
ncbi:hypothetical protein GCM10023231_04920 [Olivibacter ginsenosidimutans]|uniref:Uncharacterized protein n=1 Tax=Olivibacter ginsenosidimutans TaxID=1176537 RepID=A0ABP9AIB0_9SPHI